MSVNILDTWGKSDGMAQTPEREHSAAKRKAGRVLIPKTNSNQTDFRCQRPKSEIER